MVNNETCLFIKFIDSLFVSSTSSWAFWLSTVFPVFSNYRIVFIFWQCVLLSTQTLLWCLYSWFSVGVGISIGGILIVCSEADYKPVKAGNCPGASDPQGPQLPQVQSTNYVLVIWQIAFWKFVSGFAPLKYNIKWRYERFKGAGAQMCQNSWRRSALYVKYDVILETATAGAL